jgi:hypothetical protein
MDYLEPHLPRQRQSERVLASASSQVGYVMDDFDKHLPTQVRSHCKDGRKDVTESHF